MLLLRVLQVQTSCLGGALEARLVGLCWDKFAHSEGVLTFRGLVFLMVVKVQGQAQGLASERVIHIDGSPHGASVTRRLVGPDHVVTCFPFLAMVDETVSKDQSASCQTAPAMRMDLFHKEGRRIEVESPWSTVRARNSARPS